ncbi:Ubiquinone biosynthesis monooxygenase UbiB [Sandaracinus amylolyticus]|uniref:Ubiquinone biosynthesis monooxygenase UbiB n=1 Tax=Sandaracinus amylolyticus TaxID=927083 RepID=A0A0F6W098_9BACT|nr:Ubiquinone biosynthesis monooxygenase UbiB [Sandaracinus amylolyticus]
MSILAVSSAVPDRDPNDVASLAPDTLSALPRPSALQVLARFFVVSGILVWFSLRRVVGAITRSLDGPTAMRLAFERLGPIYVKLGQLVASGEALFPERYSEAFRTLLDRVPPFPFDEVERIVREDLGKGTSELFAELDPKPLAAASIAQVHAAKLADGREIVVKVQRPGIGALAAADVAIMRFFAWIATKLSRLARNSNVIAFVDDFAINLAQELDFRREAQRMRDFNQVMREMGNEITAAPVVLDELTHARVLTMERFRGWRIDDVQAVRATGYDAEERLLQGIRAWFQTLILRGFFHGDVHAGNFMLLEDGRIGFLDFGIVGSFGPQFRQGVLEYVLGFQSRDWNRVAEAMLAMETVPPGVTVDREALVMDLEVTFAPMIDPEEGFKLRDLVPGLVRSSRRHGLRLPRDLVLVTKQLVYLDRYSRAYGGAKMNVLTDQRLTNLIMQDMFAAMFARGS